MLTNECNKGVINPERKPSAQGSEVHERVNLIPDPKGVCFFLHLKQ